MTNRERFKKVFNNELPYDRLPVIEWASWWGATTDRWVEEGMPSGMSILETDDYFNQDKTIQFWGVTKSGGIPQPASHGAAIMENEDDYNNIKKFLFNEETKQAIIAQAKGVKKYQDEGYVVWMTLDGFFWFPRTLLGIEGHMYAFYDYPELIHRINSDLSDYYLEIIKEITDIVVPDFMTFAEDMSYNNGPMLSEEIFNEFLLPYYKKVIPPLKEKSTKIFIDTDGLVDPMIPWLLRAGIEGILPLERQAKVDVNKIKEQYPKLLLIGGYDKMVMDKGETAMRAEFERILPAMRAGGYLPSVDHQTPPGVSLENYRIYMKLFFEYAEKAVC